MEDDEMYICMGKVEILKRQLHLSEKDLRRIETALKKCEDREILAKQSGTTPEKLNEFYMILKFRRHLYKKFLDDREELEDAATDRENDG